MNTLVARLFCVVALGCPALAQAQTLPFYLVTQGPQIFSPLVGGTPLPLQFDSAATVPIGFSFNYFDGVYSNVSIGENGVLALARTCGGFGRCDFDESCSPNNICERFYLPGPWSGLPSFDPPNLTIAGFWDDLLFDSVAPASEIRYATQGVAPNREFVVEFRNMRHAFGGGGPGRSRISLQIRLFEATSAVRFQYGSVVSGNDNGNWQGLIGIEDAFGGDAVIGAACANGGNRCGWTSLQQLNNQAITIGPPNSPELTGEVVVPAGTVPGGSIAVRVTAQNLGTQPVNVPFFADVYLALAEPLLPGRDTLLGRLTFSPMPARGTQTATLTTNIPGTIAPSYYRMAAVIDPTNVVLEATEANNTVFAREQVPVGQDVAVTQVNARPVASGATDSIAFELLNATAALNNVEWAVYVSTDDLVDPLDSLVAQGATNLAAGQARMIETPFTMPVLPPTFVRFLVVADPNNALVELDEVNNLGGSDLFPVTPELAVFSVSAPANSGAGEVVDVTVFVANQGPAVPDAEYALYLSTDQNLDVTDVLAGQGTFDSPALAELQLSLTATIPLNTPRGSYFFIASLDPANRIGEADEFNNVQAAFDATTLVGPDLVVSEVAADPRAFRGAPYLVTGTIENSGGQSGRDFTYAIYVSTNRLITVQDPRLFVSAPVTLRPGTRLQVRQEVVVPATLTPGAYFLAIVADPLNSVDEQRETNNTGLRSQPIEIRDPAPDFVVTEVRAPVFAAAGESLVLQRTIENRGNAAGGAGYSVRLIPANNADPVVEVGQGIVSLAAGAVSEAADAFLVPEDIFAGIYWVEYVLDPEDLVDELDENNNRAQPQDSLEVESGQLQVDVKRLPVALVGQPYSFNMRARGGLGSLSWSVAPGVLPEGFALSAAGVLAGTGVAEGTFDFEVMVTDGQATARRALQLLVIQAPLPLEVVTRALPPVHVGQRYEFPLTVQGGVPPYQWVADTLPRGFVITSSGALAGTATAAGWSRSIQFEVQDALGDVAGRTLVLRALRAGDGVRLGAQTLPDGRVGETYQAAIQVENGQSPYLFGVSSGSLPDGVRLERGELRGEPTLAGTYVFGLAVTDARGDSDESLFVVEIVAPDTGVRFLTTGLVAGKVGEPYLEDGQAVQIRAVPSASGRSVRFRVAGGNLPAGLSLTEAGEISGVPTTAGVFGFLLVAEDEAGSSAGGAYGIVVNDDTTTPIVAEPDDGCSCNHSRGKGGLLWGLLLILPLLRRRLATVFVVMLAANTVYAQRGDGGIPGPGPGPDGGVGGVDPYLVFEELRPYVARAGGTQVQFDSFDDGEAFVTLPFSFRYFETDHTELAIGTNGLVGFLGTARDLSNESLLQPGAFPDGVIALFWDDLYNPVATTYVEGVAPSRVFIVQWDNVERYPGTPGQTISMQLWLFEGAGGRFEIHFGPSTAGNVRFDATVGYEDQSGVRGRHLVPCSPLCTGTDFGALQGRVLVATQDAGEDVIPAGFRLRTGPLGRVFQAVPFEAQVEIASLHANPIGPFRYGIHLLDPVTGALGQRVLTSSTVTLSPYQLYQATESVTIPLDVSPGRYRMALVVDVLDEVAEPNETNNRLVAREELLLGGRKPDFAATEFVLPDNASPGGSASVSVTLSNLGNVQGDCVWRLVLTSNRTPSALDRVLAMGQVSLDLRSEVTLSETVTLPAGLAPGAYRLGVILDPANAVDELDEVNNQSVSEPFLVGTNTLALAENAMPRAYVGLLYEARIGVVGGNGEYYFELSSGSLPQGLSLSEGGVIYGTPEAAGSASITVAVTSGEVSATLGPITLEAVQFSGPLAIVTRELHPGVAGQPYPLGTGEPPRVSAIGGQGPVTFTLISGAPEGLQLDPNGYLHGVPGQAGRYEVLVEATDGSATTRRTLPLVIVESGRLTLLSSVLPEAVVSERYEFSLVALGGTGTASPAFTLESGALPAGITLSSNGRLRGTPMQVGTFRFRVEVTRGAGDDRQRDSGDLVLEVVATRGFTITPSQLPVASLGQPYQVAFDARFGTAPFQWSLTGQLPVGLNNEVVVTNGAEQLRIIGTPTEIPGTAGSGGIATFLVEVTDALGQRTQMPLALQVIDPALAPQPPTEDEGCSCNHSPTDASPLWALGLLLFLRRRR